MVISSGAMSTKKRPKIRRGSAVAFTRAGYIVKAVVIDDPRPLGPDGVNLLRIRAELHDGLEPMEFDIREDRVRVLPARRRRAA